MRSIRTSDIFLIMATKLHGIISALLVSFKADGSLDEAGTRAIVKHNIETVGVDGLYVGGSTGENFMLDTATKKRLFEIVQEETAGRVPLIAQVGSLNLHEACELAKFVKQLGGYTAISAVTPFYYKFSFAEIKDYYDAIIAAADMDMIVYSIPFLTGVNLTIDNFKKLFENPRVIGVKFTAADFYLLERLRKACPNHLIFSGFDEMLLPAVVHKVDGAIGSTYNVAGKLSKKIFQAAAAGRVDEALVLQGKSNDFIEAVLANGLYQTLKACLQLSGVEMDGKMRSPMGQASQAQLDQAKQVFALIKDEL